MGRIHFLPILCIACATACAQRPVAAKPTDAPPTVADDKPLPSMRELLLDVQHHQAVSEAVRKDYTWHEHVEQQDLDGNGNVKKTEIFDYDILTVDGVPVARITARGGKPLTPDEAKKENERIDKEVQKDKERRAKLEGKGEATNARGDQLITVSRILELGTFSNPRRVVLNGRPTIVADYAGDPKAKTRNTAESVFRDLVGTVWVDEQDRALAQAQGHFLADYKIGGGLIADIRKGSSFSAQFAKINDEVWLPTRIEAQGKIRILLFAGFSGRAQIVASDYHKFRTSSTIVGSSGALGPDDQPVPDKPPIPEQTEKPKPQP